MTLANLTVKSVLFLSLSFGLSAAVIYDGGGPDGVNGRNLTSFVSAQQFTLGSAATLQGLMFFGSALVNNVPSQFSGTIGFRILSDNANTPGTSLVLGSDSTVQLVNNGTLNVGTTEYRFLVNLGSVPLGAGTYWLALHEGVMGTPNDGTAIFWDTTSSFPQGAQAAYATTTLSGLSGYSATGGRLAFQLLDTPAYNAVPEPSTWALMLTAGGFLLLRRRR